MAVSGRDSPHRIVSLPLRPSDGGSGTRSAARPGRRFRPSAATARQQCRAVTIRGVRSARSGSGAGTPAGRLRCWLHAYRHRDEVRHPARLSQDSERWPSLSNHRRSRTPKPDSDRRSGRHPDGSTPAVAGVGPRLARGVSGPRSASTGPGGKWASIPDRDHAELKAWGRDRRSGLPAAARLDRGVRGHGKPRRSSPPQSGTGEQLSAGAVDPPAAHSVASAARLPAASLATPGIDRPVRCRRPLANPARFTPDPPGFDSAAARRCSATALAAAFENSGTTWDNYRHQRHLGDFLRVDFLGITASPLRA